MLVSAIIPTHNYGRLVVGAVLSVLCQGHPHLECIVVDDGSEDDTVERLRRFRPRVRVLSRPHRGPSAARNAGIAAAHGEAVALLDADARWSRDKIARQVEVLTSRPEVGVVGCGVEHVDGQGGHLGFSVQPDAGVGPTAVRALAERRAWVGGSSSGALIRRSLLEEVGGYDETLHAAEDWDLWMRLAAHAYILNLPDILAVIARHGGGSSREPRRVEEHQWAVYRNAVERWPGLLDEPLRRRMRALILSDAAVEHVFAHRHASAAIKYLLAFREDPRAYHHLGQGARAALVAGVKGVGALAASAHRHLTALATGDTRLTVVSGTAGEERDELALRRAAAASGRRG